MTYDTNLPTDYTGLAGIGADSLSRENSLRNGWLAVITVNHGTFMSE